MENVRITFSISETVNIDLSRMAKDSGINKNAYVRQIVADSLSGRIIPRPLIQQLAIDLMGETQKIRNQYPEINLSGIDRLGNKLCQL
ncbi:hypothetical protein LAD12857_19570 [Lacrimispora amygdalina]|uniref:Ribbon-helix-helix protein CopG domain-containing protein n=1 Tax=Lacrimispora amygdalina TaxID=253257 RepID=A0ABQ5M609_9FIRM